MQTQMKRSEVEPRRGLQRMVPLERAEGNADGNTLVGYAAVFDTWADISGIEGQFRERIRKGAFERTIGPNRSKTDGPVRVLFNHGADPSIGMKPLGNPRLLEERAGGLWTETPLDDTSYNRDLKASLSSGAIAGMSFSFDVLKEEWNDEQTERTITEVKLYEFGPVTWPAYTSTSADVRTQGIYGGAPPTGPGRGSTAPDEPAGVPLEVIRAIQHAQSELDDLAKRWD